MIFKSPEVENYAAICPHDHDLYLSLCGVVLFTCLDTHALLTED